MTEIKKGTPPGDSASRQPTILSGLIGFFSSMRLAFFLIIVFTVLSFVGSLLPQVPSGIVPGSAEYETWLQQSAHPVTGAWTSILSLLQFFDVFRSVWFTGAGVLLIFNILVCTWNRLRASLKMMRRKPAGRDNSFYEALPVREVFDTKDATSEKMVASVARALNKRHYAVTTLNENGNVQTFAVKNTFSSFGTAISHLSIILVILGFIIGGVYGFENPSFAVPEGDKREVGLGTGLSLSLISFTDQYYENGAPKDYASDVIILRDGVEVARGTVRVNQPLDVGGVIFYQSFFGPAASMLVRSANGTELFKGGVALQETVEMGSYSRPIGNFDILGTDIRAYVVGPARNADPMLKSGQAAVEIYRGNETTPVTTSILEQGKPVTLAGVEITYLGAERFSGFIVKRDPGVWLIWLASALFIIGILMVFYFPRREVAALIRARQDRLRLTIGAPSSRLNSAPDIRQILEDVKTSFN